MKVVFVSDIHGMSNYAEKIKDIYVKEKFDLLVVLGDLYYCSFGNCSFGECDPSKVLEVLNLFKEKMYVIKGNCDSSIDISISNFPFYEKLLLDINNRKVFCTHGHLYNMNKLPEENFDIMVYGHLHTGFIKKIDNKVYVNPGSLSLPRGSSVNSYIFMDNDCIYLKDLDCNIIDECLL